MVRTRSSNGQALPATSAPGTSPPTHALKRKAAGDDGASSAGKHREMSAEDQRLFMHLNSVEFVLSCLESVESTANEYQLVTGLVVPLTEIAERKWAELTVNMVSLRPGLEKLSALSGLVGDYVANKPAQDLSISEVLRHAIHALPKSLLTKIHHHLSSLQINIDNAYGACLLLKDYHKMPHSLERSVLRRVRTWALPADLYWWYFVAARHALHLPLASHAFKSLSSDIAWSLMKEYGHPASWHSCRAFLEQKQSSKQSFKCHFELEGGVDILSPHVNRGRENFLLDPAVLASIRTHFISVETAEKKAKLRSHRQEEEVYF